MAAALTQCYDKQTHFREKISAGEQRAQKGNRFFRGRQTAPLIDEKFRPTGSFDGIPSLSSLFSINMENNDIQDFDLRWKQTLLMTSDPPSDKVLGGLYVSKIQESSQAHTIMALHNQEILRGGGQRDYHRMKICVKLNVEQTQMSKNFRSQNKIIGRGAVIKGKRQNLSTERKTAECNQWKAIGSCSVGESCSFLHEPMEVENARKPSNERVRGCNEQTSSAVPQVRARAEVKSSTSLEARPASRAQTPLSMESKMPKIAM